jgi:hypothetical protein
MADEIRTTRRPLVTGMFRDRASAEHAYNAVTARGYTRDDVSVMMTDETRKRHFVDSDEETELGNKALEGAGVGSAIGGTVGAILAAVVAGVSTVALPGIGLVIAGPLAAALLGAGAGGLTGGLIGGLIGAGIPEERAHVYESGIKEGGIVLGVEPRSETDAREIESEWRSQNGEHVHYDNDVRDRDVI